MSEKVENIINTDEEDFCDESRKLYIAPEYDPKDDYYQSASEHARVFDLYSPSHRRGIKYIEFQVSRGNNVWVAVVPPNEYYDRYTFIEDDTKMRCIISFLEGGYSIYYLEKPESHNFPPAYTYSEDEDPFCDMFDSGCSGDDSKTND